MILSIHQPDYIPWLGFYYKIAHSDIFVYLDDAQYSNAADHNMNLIKGPQGVQRLRVPVEQHLGDLICSVRTRDELKWKDKHLRALQMNYSKARYFKEIFPSFSEVIQSHEGTIAELNMAIDRFVCSGFNIRTQIQRSSNINSMTAREERIIDICLKLGADEYLSGNGARGYQVKEHFAQKGIKLTYTTYKPIIYTQLWGSFLSYMSALDYIFNCGFDWDYVERSLKKMK